MLLAGFILLCFLAINFTPKPVFAILPVLLFFLLSLFVLRQTIFFKKGFVVIFGFFLCALLPSFCFLIFQQGLGYFLIFLAALIGSDTMAFLLGSLFGKRLIAKELSPAKTWEGSLGGLAGAVILGLVFCYTFLRSIFYCSLGAVFSTFKSSRSSWRSFRVLYEKASRGERLWSASSRPWGCFRPLRQPLFFFSLNVHLGGLYVHVTRRMSGLADLSFDCF